MILEDTLNLVAVAQAWSTPSLRGRSIGWPIGFAILDSYLAYHTFLEA